MVRRVGRIRRRCVETSAWRIKCTKRMYKSATCVWWSEINNPETQYTSRKTTLLLFNLIWISFLITLSDLKQPCSKCQVLCITLTYDTHIRVACVTLTNVNFPSLCGQVPIRIQNHVGGLIHRRIV